jgi:5-methylcytosine-specific restriction endonuclease McrA
MSSYERDKVSPRIRRLVFRKFDGRCAYCGCKLDMKTLTIDHIEPYMNYYNSIEHFDDSPNELKNLYPACADCNNYKDNLTIEQFRKKLEDDFGSPVIFYFETMKTPKEKQSNGRQTDSNKVS